MLQEIYRRLLSIKDDLWPLFFLRRCAYACFSVPSIVFFSTHSYSHTLTNTCSHRHTHQLNWVIRAIYIIIQASGCLNSVVCGNVLVGTAVLSDRRRKQDSSIIYLLWCWVEQQTRLSIIIFKDRKALPPFYLLFLVLDPHTPHTSTPV